MNSFPDTLTEDEKTHLECYGLRDMAVFEDMRHRLPTKRSREQCKLCLSIEKKIKEAAK